MRDLPPLPPTPVFAITLGDVLARPASEHVAAVRGWAEHSHAAWAALRPATLTLLHAA